MEASTRIRCARLAVLLAMVCCAGTVRGGRGDDLGVGPSNGFDWLSAGFRCNTVVMPPHATVTLIGAGDGLVAMTFTCADGMHVVGSDVMVCHPGGGDRTGVWRRSANVTSAVATIPVCAVCPSAQFSAASTGSCYLLRQTRRGQYVTSTGAAAHCQDAGAQLVAIDDEDEQAAIVALVDEARSGGARVRDVLIGLVDFGDEGRDYRWLQRPTVAPNYTNWAVEHPMPGHPSVVLSSEDQKWTSVDRSSYYSEYICEEKAIVRCADPPTILGGLATHRNSTHPHSAHYSCNTGQELNGSADFSCSDSGLWTDDGGSAAIPTCQPVTCHAPHHLSSNTIVSSSKASDVFAYKSLVEYTCATGYRLNPGHRHGVHIVTKGNGQSFGSLQCQANGTWSERRIVKCVPCECNTNFTAPDVCDWESGKCMCNSGHHADGARCTDCVDGYFRSGHDENVNCSPCSCGVAVTKGNTCDKRTGECNCVAGCYGNCDIPQCNLYCDAETEDSLQGVLEWGKTGVTSAWTVDCPLGRSRACNATRGCHGKASRRCTVVDGVATWLPSETVDCRYEDHLTEEINSLRNENISAANAVAIASKLSAVAVSKRNITSADILLSASLLERVVATRASDVSVGRGLLRTVAALGNASAGVLAKQGEVNTTNRLLAVIDDYAVNTPLEAGETERSIDAPGIAMTLRDVDPSRVADTVRLEFAGAAAAAASVPDRLFGVGGVGGGDPDRRVRLQATVFADSALFVRRQRNGSEDTGVRAGAAAATTAAAAATSTEPAADDAAAADGPADLRVAGAVFSLTLAGVGSGNLSAPINISFAPPGFTEDEARNPTCVFWNFATSDWSSQGCELVSAGEELVCSCSHLTHFAILMDFSPQKSSKHTVVLEWITYIGLSLSLAGLIGTFLILGCYPKIRRQQQMKLLLQLCSAWTGAIVAFLIGGKLPSYPDACATFAILLHYFLLVVFMWTLAQAIFLYMALVLVYTEGVKDKFRKAIFVCWGVPVVVVAITVGATKAEAYMPRPDQVNVCVLNIVNAKEAFIAAYLTPVCLILAANLVIFSLVLRRIIKPRPGMEKRQLEDHKRDAKISISLAVLLGLTWLTGIGMIGDARIAFAYIFTILNAFLGFFIFIMHFAMRHEVVDEFRRSVSNRRQSFAGSTRTSSTRQTKASFVSDTSLRTGGSVGNSMRSSEVIDELRQQQQQQQQGSDATAAVANADANGNGSGSGGGWRPIKSVVARPSQRPLYSAVRKGSADSYASVTSSGSASPTETGTSQQSQRTTPEKVDAVAAADDCKAAPLPTVSSASAPDGGSVDDGERPLPSEFCSERQDAVDPASSPEVDV